MLSVEDRAAIRRLRRAEQMPIAQIARVRGISRNTVKAALASDGPPKYQRPPKGSVADEFEPRIWELLQAFPQMPSTVIAQAEPKTLRYRILHAAARLARSGRGRRLKISATWSWAPAITAAWGQITALPQAP